MSISIFCSRPHVHSGFDYVLMRVMRCACFQVLLICSTYQLCVSIHDRTCRWPGHKARYRHMALSALGPFPFRCDRHDGKRGKVKVKKVKQLFLYRHVHDRGELFYSAEFPHRVKH